jgi:uncharacterized protein YxeA
LKRINILIILLALVITIINIFLVCQSQHHITRIDEKIKYLETRRDAEYIEEYLQNHQEER